jgi:hypothetical protein
LDYAERSEAAVRRRRRLVRLAPPVVGCLIAGGGLVAVLLMASGGPRLSEPATGPAWRERANAIEGIIDYYKTDPAAVAQNEHRSGSLTYEMDPPVAGNHNAYWQNCMGDVYASPIANERAVHSLEHGAVWVTYRPDLPKDEIDALADRVRGKEYMFMSRYPGLDRPISLQAWGYQLKLDRADDIRIDEFIDALRENAAWERGANCADGVTDAG